MLDFICFSAELHIIRSDGNVLDCTFNSKMTWGFPWVTLNQDKLRNKHTLRDNNLLFPKPNCFQLATISNYVKLLRERERIVIFLWRRRDPKEFEQESHKALKVETFGRKESWRGWEYSKATTVQQLNSKDFILNNVRKENIIRLWLWMRNFLQEKSAHNETTAQTSKNSLPLSAGCPFSYSNLNS